MDGVSLKPLTVDFHEAGFNAKLAQENQFGPWFSLSDKEKQQLGDPMGPINPQALNRYSYTLNNPVRYVDPSGHELRYTKSTAKAARLALRPALTSLKNLIDGEQISSGDMLAAASGIAQALGAGLADTVLANLGAIGAGVAVIMDLLMSLPGDQLKELYEALVFLDQSLELFLSSSPDGSVMTVWFEDIYSMDGAGDAVRAGGRLVASIPGVSGTVKHRINGGGWHNAENLLDEFRSTFGGRERGAR